MATGKVTKRSVDALRPAAGNAFLWDDEVRGFGVKLTPKGSRSYVYQYRLGGREAKTQRYTIGAHGSPWTPASARVEAERLARLVATGVDPVAADVERRRQAVDLAFRPYAENFLERYIKVEWPASHSYAEGILRRHVTPVLGTKALPAIGRSEISEVMDRIEAGQVALRANVFSVVRRLFKWAVSRGDLDRSPLEGMDPPPVAASRDRVLEDAELGAIWNGMEGLGYPFGPMFRLLAATAKRRDEVAAMEWAELNRASGAWTIPAARSKNKQADIVPLTSLAVVELDAIATALAPPKDGNAPRWPRAGLVFSTTGTTAVSGYSRAKRRLDELVRKAEDKRVGAGDALQAVASWRLHDLRRTVATGLQRLGVRFEVTEAVLNHVSGSRSGVAGVYQRHHWADEKRAALNAWAEHIERVSTQASDEKQT